ncbi:MAG: menaquinone biosynthesis protein [Clostridia bacterium]|nr:menaquinone biosynthesis protein [Clostridia bacterium]
MRKLRLGQVDYLNCLPIYEALEEGEIQLDAKLTKGAPAQLNQLFLAGKLDITPISSIEFARHAEDCYIIPNVSIAANGRVDSILLFSKVPVTELEDKTISLTQSSATSVVLLKVLLENYYQLNSINYVTQPPDLSAMLAKADAALLIGDDAMAARAALPENQQDLYITDLGEVWKEFTGEAMVYALWVISKKYADKNPEKVDEVVKAFLEAKEWAANNQEKVVDKAVQRNPILSRELIAEYFTIIRYQLDEDYRRALLTYYDFAYKSGYIKERVKLQVWGEIDETGDHIRKSS